MGAEVKRNNGNIGDAQVGGPVNLERAVDDTTFVFGKHRTCSGGVWVCIQHVGFGQTQERESDDVRNVVLKKALIQSVVW